MRIPARISFLLVVSILLAACSTLPIPTPTLFVIPTNTQSMAPPGDGVPTYQASAVQPRSTTAEVAPNQVNLWVDPLLPAGITDGLVVPVAMDIAETREAANLYLEVGGQNPVTHLVYALAATFPTFQDEVRLEQVKKVWSGQPANGAGLTHLLVSGDTLAKFSAWWGAPGGETVIVVEPEAALEYSWANPTTWALLPFGELSPRWKVIRVDGRSPIWKDFDANVYGLSLPVSLHGLNPEMTGQVAEAFNAALLEAYDRDAGKLTTVVLTGVTALVRATAWEMETKGITHPAEDVGEMLRQADITHISNEVPFAEGCPYPDPVQRGLVFCSDPSYIGLLEAVGTDVVELTGDHFADWGTKATLYTFDLYRERGWPFYGAGETLEEGRAPITFEHNGNKIAFIGCNAKGGSYTPAVLGLPGAVDCNFEYMHGEIRRLLGEGYVVIVTFQHYEVYSFSPGPQLINDFLGMAETGAQIVSGSQAHQPHGMGFYGDNLMMYGLGNLFFDQVGVSEDTARAMIARHVIYDGRYISTEIFTVRFFDYSKPSYMDAEDRLKLLEEVFTASGW